MAKRTTKAPQPMPESGWQPIGSALAPTERLVERFPLSRVVAILDHREKSALRAKDAAETRLRLEVLRREMKEYRQQIPNMIRRAKARFNPNLRVAAERFRQGAEWKELAPEYGMSPDGLRQAVARAGHSTARANGRTPNRPRRKT